MFKKPIALIIWEFIILPISLIVYTPFYAVFTLIKRLFRKKLVITDKRFTYETFEKLSLSRKKEYCDYFLNHISEGASRVVYQLNNSAVLKLAKANKRIVQNASESYLFKHPLPMFNKVLEVGENNEWVVSQRAKPAKPSDFKRFLNIDYDLFEAWALYNGNLYFFFKYFYKKRYTKKELKALDNITPLKELKETGIHIGYDLSKFSSWGIVKDENGVEKLVIIDSGRSFKKLLND